MFDLVACILINQSCRPDTSRSLVQDKSQTLRLSRNFSPLSISTQANRILVKPTLQLEGDVKSNEGIARIFALGDVAETGGPMMARAAMLQAEIVRENIVGLIKRKKLAENTSLARRSVEVEFGQGKKTYPNPI
jgi:NADH dehydrogenase FAD-containing subunit